jgi:site-specific recombinase XerD
VKLHRAIEAYIRLRQSLGFRYRVQSYVLRAFGKKIGPVSLGQVRPVAVRAFLDGQGPVTELWSQKLSILRCFYRFALARNMVHKSPLPMRAPKVAVTFTPYIYTPHDLHHLLQAITAERTKSLSPLTMRTLLLLLYGAGLRISEALNLEEGQVDVKERLLCVQRSKFFKSWLVPIGPKLAQVLTNYERQRPAIQGAHRCFFRTERGRPLDYSTVGRVFRGLRQAAGIKRTDGARYQPRLHDLRHSMATHRLLAGYRERADMQLLLTQLSAYLGHAEIADTQIYLSLIPELREQASARFARYAWEGKHE